jgi:hypothetical protein
VLRAPLLIIRHPLRRRRRHHHIKPLEQCLSHLHHTSPNDLDHLFLSLLESSPFILLPTILQAGHHPNQTNPTMINLPSSLSFDNHDLEDRDL